MSKYDRMTDEQLLCDYKNGNQEIMDYLMVKYKSMVRKKARAMYLLGGENEDLIQEGMIGLFKAVTSYQEEELSLDEILETPEETPEEMMLRKEELNDYYKMLDQNLSKFEKQVMYHYLNGETYTTIAKKLGKSDKSIDNAIQRIRRKIRNDQES